jgi:O-antigen/teichoic acid export membrane protein
MLPPATLPSLRSPRNMPTGGERIDMGIRRALMLAAADRYLVMAISLAATVIIARLLTPAEFGVAVVGGAAWAILEAIRDLGVSNYLVQEKDLTSDRARAAFTILLILTLLLGGLLWALAGSVAQFYRTSEVEHYLTVTALVFALGPLVIPIHGLLRRDMAFGTIALVNSLTVLTNAGTAIFLAFLGYSYMSLAWASVVSGIAGTLLCFYFRPDFSIFWPSLREWRRVVAFGTYDCGTAVLNRIWDSAPYLVFGRILSTEAVGLFQRATTVCRLPERVLLAGTNAIALPALAARAREGASIERMYLRAIEYIAALQWPALLFLVLLAHPVVVLLLGPQWLDAAPLVRIMAGAALFWIPIGLTNATLIAVGAVRHTLTLMLIVVPVSMTVISLAALHSLHAAALSLLLTVPFHAFVSVYLVRVHLSFGWSDLVAAVRKSAAVACISSAGPLFVIVGLGLRSDVPVGAAVLAAVLSGVGWLAGLWLTEHPLLGEILRARDAWLAGSLRARMRGAFLWLRKQIQFRLAR